MQELLYILSPSFSGSTLLTFLLAAHPGIATVGELKASAMGPIEEYRCSCGALLQKCEFWRQVEEGMRRRTGSFTLSDFGTHFSRGPKVFQSLIRLGAKGWPLHQASSRALRIPPSFRSRLSRILQHNLNLIQLITRLQGATIFLDASKDPERLNQLWESRLWRIKVIRLIRDGRGVTNSYKKHYRVGMRLAAADWVATELACERVMSKVGREETLTLRYEEMCVDGPSATSRALSFVGLDPTSLSSQDRADSRHILGNNGTRLGFSNTVRLDEKWKHELSARDLRTFERVAGALNRQIGY